MIRRRIGVKRVAEFAIGLIFVPMLFLVALFFKSSKRVLVWTPIPLINYKYWAEAMAAQGWKTLTLVSKQYAMNERGDFDRYIDELAPRILPAPIRSLLGSYLATLLIVRRAAAVHIPFNGGPLGRRAWWWVEAALFRTAGVKTIVIPYGADVYRYSAVLEPSVRHGLLMDYPGPARDEHRIDKRVRYWTRRADIIFHSFQSEGVGRWDVAPHCALVIDTLSWTMKPQFSAAHGRNGAVRILHAPNHRGCKGTSFVLAAVEQLRGEGLDIDLVLLEGVKNAQIKQQMQEVDILVDQLVLPGYALAAIEGMASGLPVICNHENDLVLGVFRRYGFLNECPIVSASPESIVDRLRPLVEDPSLRERVGRAGRSYVERHHSYASAAYVFGAVYAKLFGNADIDLMTLFQAEGQKQCIDTLTDAVRRHPARSS